MFATSEPGNSDAAFMVLPNSDDPKIPEAVSRGYLVFTRADIDTEDARVGSTARRDAAFRSGAQIISTDYPEPAPGESVRTLCLMSTTIVVILTLLCFTAL